VPVVVYDLTFGNSRGKSFSLSAVIVPSSLCFRGIGSPQYLWRAKTASLILYLTTSLACPLYSNSSTISSIASWLKSPLADGIFSELMTIP